VLAALYAHYSEIDALRRTLAGVACAAVGLLIAVVFKMMTPLIKKRDVVGLVMLTAVFIAIGLVRLPLQMVLLVAIPFSLGITTLVRPADEGMNSSAKSDLDAHSDVRLDVAVCRWRRQFGRS